MQVDVLTPEGKIYSGEASGVKVPGAKGSFEMLENHAPIISALTEGEVRITTKDSFKLIKIQGGFVECLNNHVSVLVEGAEVIE